MKSRAKRRRMSEAADADMDVDGNGEDGEKGSADAEEGEEDACFGCLTPFPPLPKSDRNYEQDNKHHDKANGTNGTATSNVKRRPPNSHSTAAKNNRSDKVRANAVGASESSRYACTNCGRWFCIECDIFAHEVVHNCAGCLCGSSAGGGGADGEV